MPEFFKNLFDLGTLDPSDPGVQFNFAHPLPAYQWAVLIGAMAVLAAWSYRRLTGPVWARVLLCTARVMLLALLAVMMSGPQLIKPTESIEKDWVIVLVDRSSSLRIPDAVAVTSAAAGPTAGSGNTTNTTDGAKATSATDPAVTVTREEQLRSALNFSSPMWRSLSKDRTVVWLGFDSAAYELKPTAGSATGEFPDSGRPSGVLPITLKDPMGRRSNLGVAIEAALARSAARPVAGIVVLSDGRATDQIPRSMIRRLAAQQIGVYSVALGSSVPRADLAVRSVNGPSAAFINDIVPIQVQVDRTGSASTASGARVELVDANGTVLDKREITWAPGEEGAGLKNLTLTARPDTAGEKNWTVRIVPDSPDLLSDNNAASIRLALVDRPLRVLYLDGYPRWEYRYLKNLLARERSMNFAATLLSIGRRYLQEGSEVLESVPATPEQWAQWDVVMLGDIRPDVFTTQQLQQLKQRVSEGGAGLLWIAGEGAVPTAWQSTPLADLLPISLNGTEQVVRSWGAEVQMRPAPLADLLGVMRLQDATGAKPGEAASFWPGVLNDPSAMWSRLRWVQRIEPGMLKPAAEVLATVSPAGPTSASDGPSSLPAVVTMRFGAGRVVYVATDEIWRWRYGRGEDYPERFYLQLLRLLGRESVSRSGKPAILEITPGKSEVNQPVRVSGQILDQRLIDQNPLTITVRMTRTGAVGIGVADDASGTDDSPPVELVLRAEGATGSGTGARTFAATWVPTQTGKYTAKITDALLSAMVGAPDVTAQAEVSLADDELRQPETDHALLRQLSLASGGAVIPANELNGLAKLLPRREIRQITISQQRTLWDTTGALLLVVMLLTMEWVGRRVCRMA